MAEKEKDSCWNELQEFCIENREENIIALAPTGMGKQKPAYYGLVIIKDFYIANTNCY